MNVSATALMVAVLLLGAGCVPQTQRSSGTSETATNGATVAEELGVSVDLSGRGLRDVPADLLRRADVTSLDLSDNELEGALPAELRHMRSLRMLDVSGNRMTGVPAEVGQLSDLRVLDLSDNELTGLPYEIGNLKNLELLDVSGNAYSAEDLSRIEAALPETTVIKR